MNKKKIIIIILVILILFGIYMLYNTFAVSTIASNNSDNIYDIDINEDTIINVPKSSSKTIYFHIKNTNRAAIKYGVGYNNSSNIEVKVYEDSKDKAIDIIGYGDNKYIKLYLNNPTNNDNTVTISCVLGYENGGDLIILDDISLITEVYTPPVQKTTLAEHITDLYNDAEKSMVKNNSITYNYASSESLMNDRLGNSSTDFNKGNIRYYGADPNNYVYFNCTSYPDTNCELWRIIGVFDGKVKLIRSKTIGKYPWNGSYINEWSEASLMKLFNPGYDSESVGGSLYYNGKSGTCYTDGSNTSSCNFTSSGIKNDATRGKIAEVVWNLGGWNNYSVYSNEIYGYERGTKVYSGHSTTWTGKVALPYPSDYGYATDFNKCTQNLYNYDFSYDSYACRTNDWLYSIITNSSAWYGWFLTPSTTSSNVYFVNSSGEINYSGFSATYPQNVTPTLFLNSSETIVEGTTGSKDNPYKLNP